MRFLDFWASLLGLIILSPLFILITLIIKATSPGPIFYRALRVGRHEKAFHVYKFRTMVVDADKQGPGITTSGDSRITGIGRFLRRTKLDELPQLINVLKGEMSLVGPRPEDPRYVAHYNASQRQLLAVRPGITSPASLHYRHEESLLAGENWQNTYLEKILPHKLALELDYLQHRSWKSDLGLIWQTILSMSK